MNAQYLMNKEISVQYAYKKDGKGERHGDEAERMLAAQAKKHNVQPNIQPLPPQLFEPIPSATDGQRKLRRHAKRELPATSTSHAQSAAGPSPIWSTRAATTESSWLWWTAEHGAPWLQSSTTDGRLPSRTTERLSPRRATAIVRTSTWIRRSARHATWFPTTATRILWQMIMKTRPKTRA